MVEKAIDAICKSQGTPDEKLAITNGITAPTTEH
jgi:hypothetical protein